MKDPCKHPNLKITRIDDKRYADGYKEEGECPDCGMKTFSMSIQIATCLDLLAKELGKTRGQLVWKDLNAKLTDSRGRKWRMFYDRLTKRQAELLLKNPEGEEHCQEKCWQTYELGDFYLYHIRCSCGKEVGGWTPKSAEEEFRKHAGGA